jgi:hypothetical protein
MGTLPALGCGVALQRLRPVCAIRLFRQRSLQTTQAQDPTAIPEGHDTDAGRSSVEANQHSSAHAVGRPDDRPRSAL